MSATPTRNFEVLSGCSLAAAVASVKWCFLIIRFCRSSDAFHLLFLKQTEKKWDRTIETLSGSH